MKLELAHDILAKKVAEKVSAEDKQIRKINAFVKERFQIYNARKTTYLETEDIEYIKPFSDKLDLSEEERSFVSKSIIIVKNKNRFRIILGSILILFILSIGFVALYLQSQSDNYKMILTEKEYLVKEKADEIEIKSEALKDKLKEEEDLDIRLNKIQSLLDNLQKEINDSNDSIEINKSKVLELDTILNKERPAKVDYFRSQIAKPENWSEFLGEFDWESANKKCLSIGQSLPNKLELESIVLKNPEIIQKWKMEKCCKVWTNQSDSIDKATLYDFSTNNSEVIFKDNVIPVHCIK